ncbi:ABC transporter permease [Pollutimonas harenae]|uniref:SMP-30/gluconolactonase/LRE family protein n=1 Tax=Pollutimonas harenae TaxID=657015 RepID=A0A853H4T2_9BURK|nr:SMP-30/gluconolactonase/LRE family protein [Pollutimonas harenae]NYT86929.1 SMP-30/gluconolactonase/LRE family protein [Pollutimonas harenae]TEA69359.1 ABC transporter permease [Pollutimonas harenae]
MDTVKKLRYRYWPDRAIGELLAKQWMETAVPLIVLLVVVAVFASIVDNFLSFNSISVLLRQASEIGFIVCGMALVLIVGGIDLSVGSMYAICNVVVLYLIHVLEWPVLAAIGATLVCGALMGAVNGVLIGYLKLRAFLTTLVTLIIFRAIFNLIQFKWAVEIASTIPDSDLWDQLGNGSFLGLPISMWIFLVVAILFHIFLTRMRGGWHMMAVGGSRRSAYNSGLSVNRIAASAYVASGVFAAVAAVLFAARVDSSSADTGIGLEIIVLAAALLGGIRLGGGKGSVAKVVLGTLIVLIVTNSLRGLSVPAGYIRMALAFIMIAAVTLDIRWFKNRGKALRELYVSPGYLPLPAAPSVGVEGSGSPYAVNNKLGNIERIGLGMVESPEDVILDEDDNLYCGTRHGNIMRFFAPDYQRSELYAHIGGQPLGMAFDKSGNIYVCVGGMGLYRVNRKDRSVDKVTDETGRSLMSVVDDSRLRLADDLDIAPDGRIFFSEATVRYEMHEWPIDSLEGRGNGRIICYDPNTGRTHTALKNLVFPNGVCMASDGQSLLFAESWACRISRYWFDGPKKGTVEVIIPDLPGYPDNINRASDGNYWIAIMGMRSPTFDLAMRSPAFRRRMVKRLGQDEWLAPNINVGCVIKCDENGQVLESYWDRSGENHPMITSMREHRGYLYLGGISNNRIGRYKLEDADPEFMQYPIERA